MKRAVALVKRKVKMLCLCGVMGVSLMSCKSVE